MPELNSDQSASQGAGEPPHKGASKGWIKIALLGVVVLSLFIAFKLLPVKDYLEPFLNYVESLGIWGPILLAVVYVIATVLLVPGES